MDPLPSPSPETWLPVDGSPESMTVRALVFGMILLASGMAAWLFMGKLLAWRGRVDEATRRAIGRPTPQPWATGEWACGRCRSLNRRTADRCDRCRATRAEAEIRVVPVETEPDILPAHIPAGIGSIVTLEHHAAAHTDGLNGHWRLKVDGVIVGSAARRDGALALLRAVEGTRGVLYDPRGMGYAPYPLDALIDAFEGPTLPVAGPCPEATPPR